MNFFFRPTFSAIGCFLYLLLYGVIISPVNAAVFPYRFTIADIPAVCTGAALFGIGTALEIGNTKEAAQNYDPLSRTRINTIDRHATALWHPGVDKAGDFAVAALLVTPAIAGFSDLKKHNAHNLLILAGMYGENILLTLSLCSISKALVQRHRPYSYNAAIPAKERETLMGNSDAHRSFFSQHTALAFSSSVFLSTSMKDIYGTGWQTRTVQIASLTAATAVGVSRVISGQHFPSDVFIGAAAGGITGYLVTRLHRTGSQVAVTASGDGIYLGWRY